MGDVGQPGAREQWANHVKWPQTFVRPEHDEWARDFDALKAEADALRNALHLAYAAMREPFNDWKGSLERRAMDAYHAALAAGRMEGE